MDEDRILSPSQIAAYSPDYGGCNRKWAWRYIEGIKEPPHPSAEKGTRVHAILEAWLRDGVPIPDTEEGQIAMAGVPYLPPPGKHNDVEQAIFLKSDVASYRGLIDLSYVENGVRVVHDHKTTSDFGWAKSEKDLLTDPQGVIYSAEAMSRYEVREVKLKWLYLRTKGARRALPVIQPMVWSQAVDGMGIMDGHAAEMLGHHRSGRRALDLEPNPEACSAYGGCPHIARCNLTVSDLRAATMRLVQRTDVAHEKGRELMGLLDGLAKAKQPAAAPATPAPEAPVTARPAPQINPPESKVAAPAAVKAENTALLAALKDIAAALKQRDIRDEMVLAILTSGAVEQWGNAYALADELLKKRGG